MTMRGAHTIPSQVSAVRTQVSASRRVARETHRAGDGSSRRRSWPSPRRPSPSRHRAPDVSSTLRRRNACNAWRSTVPRLRTMTRAKLLRAARRGSVGATLLAKRIDRVTIDALFQCHGGVERDTPGAVVLVRCGQREHLHLAGGEAGSAHRAHEGQETPCSNAVDSAMVAARLGIKPMVTWSVRRASAAVSGADAGV